MNSKELLRQRIKLREKEIEINKETDTLERRRNSLLSVETAKTSIRKIPESS